VFTLVQVDDALHVYPIVPQNHAIVLANNRDRSSHRGTQRGAAAQGSVARARAAQWLIAALNSVEPAVWNVFVIDNLYTGQKWAKLRRPGAVELMNKKLDALAGLSLRYSRRLSVRARIRGERRSEHR
jgi:hypothetical protein